MKRMREVPIEIVLKGEVLGHQNCLTVLFHHMEVIGWVDFALEENALASVKSRLL